MQLGKLTNHPRLPVLVFTGALLCLCIFSHVSVLSAAGGRTFYAAPYGDDSVSCTAAQSIATPKRTGNYAVDCMQAGDTLFLRAGTYPGFNVPGGSAGNYTVIKSYPGEKATIDVELRVGSETYGHNMQAFTGYQGIAIGGYTILEDLEFTSGRYNANPAVYKAGWACSPKDDACMTAVTCDLNDSACQILAGEPTLSGPPFVIAGGSNSIVRNNVIHDLNQVGLSGDWIDSQIVGNTWYHIGVRGLDGLYCSYAYGINVVFSGNVCHDSSGSDGFRLGSGTPGGVLDGWVIENNLMYNNGGRYFRWNYTKDIFIGGAGLTLYDGVTNSIIRNNISYGNRDVGFGIRAMDKNVKVYNNTSYDNRAGFYNYIGNAPDYLNNIAFGNFSDWVNGGELLVPPPSNFYQGDPLFVDAKSGDFHIRAGSTAIGAGINLSTVFTTDFAGYVRPSSGRWTSGAFEFGSTSSSVLVAPVSPPIVSTPPSIPPPAITVPPAVPPPPDVTSVSTNPQPPSSSLGGSPQVSSIGTPSITAKEALNPPVIDGNLSDDVWSAANSTTFSVSTRSDNQVTVFTLWDKTSLYIAYRVMDNQVSAADDVNNLWQDDGAEILLDTANNKGSTWDANDYHLVTNIHDLTSLSPSNGTSAGIKVKTQLIAGGYTQEIAIPWNAISAIPAKGMTMGLLLANNDKDGNSSMQIDWQSLYLTSYFVPSQWGSLVIGSETVGTADTTAPIVSSVKFNAH